jgi:hypothetical protein
VSRPIPDECKKYLGRQNGKPTYCNAKALMGVVIAGIRRSGFTDRQIGAVLGTTRQAVEQRWPRASMDGRLR